MQKDKSNTSYHNLPVGRQVGFSFGAGSLRNMGGEVHAGIYWIIVPVIESQGEELVNIRIKLSNNLHAH